MEKPEMRRYHAKLLTLRQRVEEDFEGLRVALGREGHPVGEVHSPTHAADHDSEGLDVVIAMEETEASIAAAIEEALLRMEAGTYGLCDECGGVIPKERLHAMPYAPRCIGCARAREEG